eukprot:CAMPEP_0203863052 /NCGR_PEP_ID=MMETSP0359-20131031/13949_1 /ASSEMBLY_ACC=CAM_ASM_000338 /TAXON_ID=268821 /ORGANISM="Scrippsiella Hangoei, Strain SHTV-5" /LENGTH=40 /DNA_ID= /DNA_START= /DNA_END= /DNA_ORIENTATION=
MSSERAHLQGERGERRELVLESFGPHLLPSPKPLAATFAE